MPRRISYAAPPQFPIPQRAAEIGQGLSRILQGVGGLLERKADENNAITRQGFTTEIERIK